MMNRGIAWWQHPKGLGPVLWEVAYIPSQHPVGSTAPVTMRESQRGWRTCPLNTPFSPQPAFMLHLQPQPCQVKGQLGRERQLCQSGSTELRTETITESLGLPGPGDKQAKAGTRLVGLTTQVPEGAGLVPRNGPSAASQGA